MSEERTNPATVILAFALGAAAGAVAALLTAPRSGRETRRRLGSLAEEAAGEAARVPPALTEACARAARAARDAFVETLRSEGVPLVEPPAGRPPGTERQH
ncbi:MAG: YtxH domain-containing protein [Candidatus Polarisedimenticolia bacterium]